MTIFAKTSILNIWQAVFTRCFCEYNSTISKEHFLLLNIEIKRNFQSHSVIRNSNENELIWYSHAKWIERSQTSKNREKNGWVPQFQKLLRVSQPKNIVCYVEVNVVLIWPRFPETRTLLLCCKIARNGTIIRWTLVVSWKWGRRDVYL